MTRGFDDVVVMVELGPHYPNAGRFHGGLRFFPALCCCASLALWRSFAWTPQSSPKRTSPYRPKSSWMHSKLLPSAWAPSPCREDLIDAMPHRNASRDAAIDVNLNPIRDSATEFATSVANGGFVRSHLGAVAAFSRFP
jgi:hypothetical protein